MSWTRHRGRLVLDRRAVLRGMLGGAAVTFGLPALHAMLDDNGAAFALDGAFPKRFGLFFWGNGNRPELWAPAQAGLGDAWALSETLQPLAALKHKLTVVTGTAVKLPNDSPHASGAAGLLTGAPLGDILDDYSFTAPTIDQVVASSIGGETIYRSIETGVGNATGRSFNGSNSRNPTERSPLALYERVFGATFREPGQPTVDPRLGLRRSALDAVMTDIDALRQRVGAADRARLDQHYQGVRDLELRLARLEEPADLAACVRPEPPEAEYPEVDGRLPVHEINAVMGELIAMMLACDQTRVFSHWFSDPVSDVLYPGRTAGHHDLTHNEPFEQPEVQAITVQCVEAYAALLAALDAVPEGDGTVLDHCAVLACSEVSLGQTHSILDMPILIGGSAGGALRTDQHYRSLGQENVSKVSLSLLQAVGIRAASFGAGDGLADEPISDLFV
ncbi:MAG TPA: DUF1552 domain-containing protein [Myxococcota bacterium]|nr:DUF1552 domain-containing protein [Myxococcota bacterium]